MYETENNLTTAKVVVCILKANKFETTLEEVLENTNEIELAQFIIDFQTALYDVDDNQTKDAKTKVRKVRPIIHNWDFLYYAKTYFHMTKEEFLYEYDLATIYMLINQHNEQQYKINWSEESSYQMNHLKNLKEI